MLLRVIKERDSMHKCRVYLDYNIYVRLANKNIEMPAEYEKYSKVYISVAHAEEFYNAQKNDRDNQNVVQLQLIEKLLTKDLNNNGVLNPTQASHIINKQENFSESLKRVREHDTDTFIQKSASIMHSIYEEKYKNLRNTNKNVLNFSNLPYQDIWEQPEVITEVNKFEAEVEVMNQSIYTALKQTYGSIIASEQERKGRLEPFPLMKDLFKGKRQQFKKLEFIMEFLQNVLNICGYCKETTERTVKSGVYDTEHSIYATYCNFFITEDRRLRNRLNAIYYYLGLETRCFSFQEWCDMLK